jgi:hypothetical protein
VSRRRVDAIGVAFGWLARAGLLALWAAVGWGTLLLLAAVAGALRDGPSVAVSRLLPAPGGGPWAWLNASTAAIAAVVWLVAAGLVVAVRWPRRPPSGGETAAGSAATAPEALPARSPSGPAGTGPPDS